MAGEKRESAMAVDATGTIEAGRLPNVCALGNRTRKD